MILEKARIESNEQIAGAQLGAKAVTDDKTIKAKELLEGAKMGVEVVNSRNKIASQENLEGAKLGASSVQKNNDLALRAQESQARNAAKVDVTKLKDETQLNERE